MLTTIIIIVVAFITFCATPLGRELIEKLNDYNYKKEMEKINKDLRADMKRIDEENGTDVLGYLDRKEQEEQNAIAAEIERLKTDPDVLIAYSNYLDDISNRRRRVKKVLDLEEFIFKNYIEK